MHRIPAGSMVTLVLLACLSGCISSQPIQPEGNRIVARNNYAHPFALTLTSSGSDAAPLVFLVPNDGQEHTLSRIPGGVYDCTFSYGEQWNPRTRQFHENLGTRRIDTLDFHFTILTPPNQTCGGYTGFTMSLNESGSYRWERFEQTFCSTLP